MVFLADIFLLSFETTDLKEFRIFFNDRITVQC